MKINWHIEQRAIADLKAHPKNPRAFTKKGLSDLTKSVERFGLAEPIVINTDGLVIGGHARLEVLRSQCAKECDCYVPDRKLTAKECDELNIRLNANIAGEWDFDILANEWDADELTEWGMDIDINPGVSDVDAEPQMDRAEELRAEWGTARGQLWKLGEHRLLCGDSTDAADVLIALDGSKPLLMVTDPPYGVEYDANWRNEADRKNGKPYGASAVGRVTNDNRADWSDAWRLFPGDVVYSWHPAGAPSLVHAAALQDSGFAIRMQIIWAKNQFPIGRGNYHVKHEPCWYCVRDGATAHFVGDRSQTTLWEIDKPHKSETGHSTQKPVECMLRPIRNHDSEYVYEPFGGSGTTIIACEQLGRKCRAIEISPAYVAVSLQRYFDATGVKPELIHA